MAKGYVRRHNKVKIVTMTGDGKLSKKGILTIQGAVDKAVDKGYYIFTADTGELDREVVRRTNSVSYDKVVVWGVGGSIRWYSKAGKNKPVPYMAAQRDDVMVARSDYIILAGRTARVKGMKKFGTDLGRRVGVIK